MKTARSHPLPALQQQLVPSVEDTTDNQLDLTFDFDQIDTTTADRVTVAIDFGSLNQASGFTRFKGNFTPNFIEQNGKQFGSLSAVNIDENGITTALFDNGETRDIFQVPVVTFNNPNGRRSEPVTSTRRQQIRTGGRAGAGRGGAGQIAPSAWSNPRSTWRTSSRDDRHATGLLGQYADHHHC